MSGIYRPRVGDVVIGYIVDIGLTGWTVDIKSPYSAYLPVQEATLKPIDLTTVDLKDLLGIGDIVLARIIDFNLTRDYPVTLTLKEARLGRIEGGTLVEIDASKVARVIGRRGGSMVGIFDEELNCDVTVGQNGRIWIRCRNPEDEPFVARVIKLIESESHTSGLTDRVKAIVSQYKEKKAGTKAQAHPHPLNPSQLLIPNLPPPLALSEQTFLIVVNRDILRNRRWFSTTIDMNVCVVSRAYMPGLSVGALSNYVKHDLHR